MSQANPTTFEAGTQAAVKKIPILGQAYSVMDGVSNILTKALPFVYTQDEIHATAIAKFNEKAYNAYKDYPYFWILFDDPNFTVPTIVLGGITPMEVFTPEQYQQAVSDGGVINGMAVKPLQGKYLLFPNVVEAYVTEQVRIANEEMAAAAATSALSQSQAAALQAEKDQYGILYPIVDWFRTNTLTSDLKAGLTEIGDSVQGATNTTLATQSTWTPWAIGALAVFGGIAIIYVILD